jgi:YggT family protein
MHHKGDASSPAPAADKFLPNFEGRPPAMIALLNFISYLITLYIYVIIAAVVLSWLIGFGIMNLRNPMVRSFYNLLQAVTEPVMAPIRRILPDLGAIDISPLIVLLLLQFVQQVVLPNIARAFIH